MNQPVLEFKNVTWTYEDMDHPALRDVSFTVDRGELVGIVGVNDAGKSTLCRLCNGLIPSQRSQTASSAADSSARILVICSMIPALLWRRET